MKFLFCYDKALTITIHYKTYKVPLHKMKFMIKSLCHPFFSNILHMSFSRGRCKHGIPFYPYFI